MGLQSRFRADCGRIHAAIQSAASVGRAYSPELLELVLVLEDRRFADHNGVDLLAAARAFARWIIRRPRGGASTIDMQLARTITGYRAKTIARKLYESALAVAIRRSASAEAVLLAYLDVAYFGPGVRGAEAAAFAYFKQPTAALSLPQCAELAAMLVYPLPKRVEADWVAKVEQRARYGMKRRCQVTVRLPWRIAGLRRELRNFSERSDLEASATTPII
jgi:membrane carboxypeptidase/penicillin-binding protein PbpC